MQKHTITFDQLPTEMFLLREEVRELKRIISDSFQAVTSSDEETPIPIADAAKFLGVAVQTIYQNIGKVPHRKRHGRLYFYKSELAEYLNSGKA